MSRVVAIAAALCGAFACGDEAAVEGPAERVQAAAEGRTVVAQVNGRPVFADCVQTQARAHALDVRAALDECIDFELLAQEAEARGFGGHPDALEVQRREAVRRLLASAFEPDHATPADVPTDVVRMMWKRPITRYRFDRPEVRWALYARVPLARETPDDAPEARAARRLADDIYAAVAGRTLTSEEFIETLRPLREQHGFELATEPYDTPLKGRAEESFARALFEIPAVGRAGKPVRTPWGWDVIYLVRLAPEVRLSMEQAADEIREAVFGQWRQQAFLQWAAKISSAARVEVAEGWTERLPVDPFELQ